MPNRLNLSGQFAALIFLNICMKITEMKLKVVDGSEFCALTSFSKKITYVPLQVVEIMIFIYHFHQ